MSEEMNLFDVIYNCRAMRRLDQREVPEEQLVKLVDAANQAPSGSNMQNGRWIVVRDAAVRKKLADLNRKGVESYINPDAEVSGLPHHAADKRKRMLDSVIWQKDHMHEIPLLIVACLEYGQGV